MRKSGEERHDGAMARMLLLLLHAGFGWMLTRIARVAPPPTDDAQLQVVYAQAITRDARRERRELSIAPAKPRAQAVQSASTASTVAPAPITNAMPAATTTQPLSAVFIEQGRQAIARQERSAFAPADPFASRKARLPATDAGRIRMRRQRTPEALVNAVARYLFAPKGYEQDPCPRNRANIGALITAGDSAALQDELAFERSHCRP